MISVSVPKEISDYKEKVIFGLSLRQLVCGVIAVGLAVATGLLLVQVLGLSIDIAGYIIMVEVVPLMALGFVRPRGGHLRNLRGCIWTPNWAGTNFPIKLRA